MNMDCTALITVTLKCLILLFSAYESDYPLGDNFVTSLKMVDFKLMLINN